jgi:hypothetical protein
MIRTINLGIAFLLELALLYPVNAVNALMLRGRRPDPRSAPRGR